jgi:hypothetical protein
MLTDIMEFQLPAGKAHRSPLIDCFSGMVVSWTIGTSPTPNWFNVMFDTAIACLSKGEHPLVSPSRRSPKPTTTCPWTGRICWEVQRSVGRDWVVQNDCRRFQITREARLRPRPSSKVTVAQWSDGACTCWSRGRRSPSRSCSRWPEGRRCTRAEGPPGLPGAAATRTFLLSLDAG